MENKTYLEALTNFATVQLQLLKYSFTETVIVATAEQNYEMFMNVSYYG